MNLKEIMLANGIDNAVIDKITSEMKANKDVNCKFNKMINKYNNMILTKIENNEENFKEILDNEKSNIINYLNKTKLNKIVILSLNLNMAEQQKEKRRIIIEV